MRQNIDSKLRLDIRCTVCSWYTHGGVNSVMELEDDSIDFVNWIVTSPPSPSLTLKVPSHLAASLLTGLVALAC